MPITIKESDKPYVFPTVKNTYKSGQADAVATALTNDTVNLNNFNAKYVAERTYNV